MCSLPSFIHLRCSFLESALQFLFGACATPDQVTTVGESRYVSSFLSFVTDGCRKLAAVDRLLVLVGHLSVRRANSGAPHSRKGNRLTPPSTPVPQRRSVCVCVERLTLLFFFFPPISHFVLAILVHICSKLSFSANLCNPLGYRRLFPPRCNQGSFRFGGEVQASC
jgi:hypothetical protein